LSSATKKKPSDTVANCLRGDSLTEMRNSVVSKKSELDSNRVFGLTTNQINIKKNPSTQPHANSFELIQHKDVSPNDIDQDEYSKQRTKEEVL